MSVRTPPKVMELSVHVEDDALILNAFRETDPEVVAFAREAHDPEQATHRCLAVGARAIRLAGVSVDTALVEKAFTGMTVEFQQGLEKAVGQISGTAEGLLSVDDGELPQALRNWRDEVSELLEDAFDPSSKRSLIARLEAVLEEAGTTQVKDVRRLLDPDNDESPVGRFMRTVREQVAQVNEALVQIQTQFAVRQTEAQMAERTTGKGFSFEDLIHELAAPIAAVHGDIAEQVGRVSGATGTQVGDEVVAVNVDDLGGREARYVLEVKDRRMSLRGILDELDEALANRQADAALAVFSRDGNAPINDSFQEFGNRAIVVVDKEDPDLRALRLACAWARWVVRRSLASVDSEIDRQQVESLIAEGRRRLGRVTTIKRAHAGARKRIDEAGSELEAMASEFDETLDQLTDSLG